MHVALRQSCTCASRLTRPGAACAGLQAHLRDRSVHAAAVQAAPLFRKSPCCEGSLCGMRASRRGHTSMPARAGPDLRQCRQATGIGLDAAWGLSSVPWLCAPCWRLLAVGAVLCAVSRHSASLAPLRASFNVRGRAHNLSAYYCALQPARAPVPSTSARRGLRACLSRNAAVQGASSPCSARNSRSSACAPGRSSECCTGAGTRSSPVYQHSQG